MDRLRKVKVISFFAVAALGTLLHFLYDLLGEPEVLAWLMPINESIWEHAKLLFWPYLLVAAIGAYWLYRPYPDLVQGETVGLLAGLAVVIAGYYVYSGILGFHLMAVDISLYYAGVLVAECVSCRYLRHHPKVAWPWGGLVLGILALAFVALTYQPPELALFIDPESGTFGLR